MANSLLRSSRSDWLGVAAVFLYMAMLAIAFPRGTVAVSDDFGYLDTAARSIALGHPVTSDWLEPNSVLIGVLALVAFALTKSFYFSTFGILCLFSIANLFLLARLLRVISSRSLSHCLLVSCVFLSLPIFFSKLVDFTGFSAYIFFFILSLIFFERRNPFATAVSILAAFCLRESAVCLLILFPFLAVSEVSNRRIAWSRAVATSLSGAMLLVAMFVVKKYANITYAQRHVTFILFHGLDHWNALSILAFSVSLFAAAYAIYSLLFSDFKLKTFSLRSLLFLLICAIIWSLGWLARYPSFVLWEAPGLAAVPWLAFALSLTSFIGVVLFGMMKIDLISAYKPVLVLALANCIVLAIAGRIWDYYVFEILLCALLLSVRPSLSSLQPKKEYALFALFGIYAILVSRYAVFLGIAKETARHNIIIYERLFRDGYSPTAFENMPFGYSGWKLFPYYTRNEGLRFQGLARFLCYRDSSSLSIVRDLDNHDQDVRGGRVVGRYRLASWWNPERPKHYMVISRKGPKSPYDGEYCKAYIYAKLASNSSAEFPLSDPEWAAYIRRIRAQG